MKSPVEQLPRRACAAGLTDSRASRASRATRGDAHPARQSAHWQYCTSQHGVEQCIQGIVLGANQHASGQSTGACCAPWRSASSPPNRHSHHCTAAHERPQLHCSTLKLRSLPLLSQLCAVQRASSAAPGRPVARPGGCGTEARRASASRIGGMSPASEPQRVPTRLPASQSGGVSLLIRYHVEQRRGRALSGSGRPLARTSAGLARHTTNERRRSSAALPDFPPPGTTYV